MNFAAALLIYLVFFVFFLWGFTKYGMGFLSAVTLTALLSGLILLVLVPPSEIEDHISKYFSNKPHNKCDNWIAIIYLFLFLFTALLISIFVVLKACEDRAKRTGEPIISFL